MPIPQIPSNIQSPQHWRDKTPAKKIKKPLKEIRHQAERARNKFNKASLIKKGIYIFVCLLIIGFIYVFFLSLTLPNPNKLQERQVAESTKIYDRECKTLLYEIAGNQKRTLVELKDIPTNVQNATIAIEDKNFREHGGFSLWSIFRTVVTNVIFHKKAGGSTLTQQFVKNAILTNEKTYTRKLKEIILAYRIEKKFNKDQILQMYLNEIPYGSNTYGVEAASQFYFGKNVKDTNLAEAATLAAIVQAPSRYSPYGPNKDLLIQRQQYVLDLMAEQGYVKKEEAEAAKKTTLKFQQRIENMSAPHFVMYIKELIAEKYGEKTAESSGFKICTTLDVNKQQIAERIVKEQSLKNQASYNASNAALVAMDPKTGEVLAMVGSRDYFDETIDGQVNVALKARQPGSSFKPIVYTAAFQKGFLPETMVYDTNTNFSTDPAKTYEPRNYNGNEYGPISLRMALAGSLNTPAVKTMYLAGIDNVLELAKNLGYTTLNDKDRFGLSLVLGGGEVKLIEHVRAYAALARSGEEPEIVFIKKIEDKDGKILEEFKEPKITRVIDANIANMTTSILSDNNARSFIFTSNNYLNLANRPVAAKTGTTNDYRDAWTLGYTPSLVTGVWVGNNDNSEMKRGADGSIIAAPIWNRFMREALGNSPIETFTGYKIPDNTRSILLGKGFAEQKIKIDKASGLLATDQTPVEMVEEKTYAQTHDILYYVDKNNPNGDAPKNPSSDPQFAGWEKGVANWVENKKKKDPNFLVAQPPTESDNLHIITNKPTFTVNGVADNQIIDNPNLPISIYGSSARGLKLVEYYINGNLFTANGSEPFGLNRSLDSLVNGNYKLTIKACDDIYNCTAIDYSITLQLAGGESKNEKFSVSWAGPANNFIFKESNIPLDLKVNVLNPANIAAIKFYRLRGDKAELIGTKKIVRQDVESIRWSFDKAELPGNITIYAEAENWQGQKISTAKTTITYQPEKKN